MASLMIISCFFTDEGELKTGLTPTVTIWNVTDSEKVVDAGGMTEVGEGLYRYEFSTYNPSKAYVFIADGGNSLNTTERYKAGSNASDQSSYATVAGSLGEAMLAFAKGKYEFNKVTKQETLYREDGVTSVKTRTVTDSPTRIVKQ